MRKSVLWGLGLLVLGAFASCGSDDEKVEAPSLKLSTNSVVLSADGTASEVQVTTNQNTWKASRPDGDTWCVLSQEGNTLVIKADVNEAITERSTKVTVVAGTGTEQQTEEISVVQSAANAYLTVEGLTDNAVEFSAESATKEFTIKTNASEWKASRPEADDWCTLTQNGNLLKVDVTAYQVNETRSTTVTVTGGASPVEFTVSQKGEALVYSIAIPTDFSKSFVQKVTVGGVKVAEICKEYLRSTTTGAEVDAQMVVIYPVVDGKTDLTKGIVTDNGGTAVWNVEDNTLAYTAGTSSAALTTLYFTEGALKTSVEDGTKTVEATVEPELLVDTRPNDTKWSYKITKIGTQYWMAENLKARAYVDGTAIPKLSGSEWDETKNGAYMYPLTEENYLSFGALYNGHAMYEAKGLAPEGWIVPSDDEWKKLVEYVGPTSSSGKKFRDPDGFWISGTHTNVTGFSAVAAGCYNPNSQIGYTEEGKRAYWWSTTKAKDLLVDKNNEAPKAYFFSTGGPGLMNDPFSSTTWVKNYEYGMSVRCVRK